MTDFATSWWPTLLGEDWTHVANTDAAQIKAMRRRGKSDFSQTEAWPLYSALVPAIENMFPEFKAVHIDSLTVACLMVMARVFDGKTTTQLVERHVAFHNVGLPLPGYRPMGAGVYRWRSNTEEWEVLTILGHYILCGEGPLRAQIREDGNNDCIRNKVWMIDEPAYLKRMSEYKDVAVVSQLFQWMDFKKTGLVYGEANNWPQAAGSPIWLQGLRNLNRQVSAQGFFEHVRDTWLSPAQKRQLERLSVIREGGAYRSGKSGAFPKYNPFSSRVATSARCFVQGGLTESMPASIAVKILAGSEKIREANIRADAAMGNFERIVLGKDEIEDADVVGEPQSATKDNPAEGEVAKTMTKCQRELMLAFSGMSLKAEAAEQYHNDLYRIAAQHPAVADTMHQIADAYQQDMRKIGELLGKGMIAMADHARNNPGVEAGELFDEVAGICDNAVNSSGSVEAYLAQFVDQPEVESDTEEEAAQIKKEMDDETG